MSFPAFVKVTEIVLDFTYDDPQVDEIDVESQDEIYDEILNTEWHVVDEDDLIEEITDRYGWCVKSLSYVESIQEVV